MSRMFDTAAYAPNRGGMRDVGAPVRDGRSFRLAFKRGLDVGTVALSLIVFLPLVLTLIAVMAMMQGRPILIRHKRVGRNGMPFSCLKLRTMVVNGDEILASHIALNPSAAIEWSAARKLKNDPRVTPLGRILRKSSVDELPQLFNVLRGDMSLVGPRPIVTDEVHHYGSSIDHYHSVRPGLTGLWQVSGRSDVSYKSRVQLDAEYVSKWSLRTDISILLKTIPAVLASRGSY